ncbi:MAG: hypothetical protein L3K19_04045 [Thermoplasmata archaeon]|nr:hypothetical protein [Thermoplasmata archaeon]
MTARGRVRSNPKVVIGMALAVLSLLAPQSVVSAHLSAADPHPFSPSQTHIDHVVIVMLENHAYDNYFGTYCRTTDPFCSSTGHGIPYGTCVPYDPTSLSLGCLRTWNFTVQNLSTDSPPHYYNNSVRAIDSGRMDGFYLAEHNGTLPFGHYNGSTIPVYWDLAEQYGLGDNFYSSELSYSLPNHWYLMAGQSPQNAQQITLHQNSPKSYLHTYLNEANRTKTVQDLLNHSRGVTWKAYDWPLPSYQVAINGPVGLAPGSAYDNWNVLASRSESYSSSYNSHFVDRSQFFTDVAAGKLPSISWVTPATWFSDHPSSNITNGEGFVSQLVDAVENSTSWAHTAIFVSWDDYGGFYDHMAPPRLDSLGLSIRVPLLVISPYSKENYVSHKLGYFESLLHYVEWQFQLGCLTPRDCKAPLPFDFFNFNQTARKPMFFSLADRYPMKLQTNGRQMPDSPGDPLARDPTYWDSQGNLGTNVSLGEVD